MSLLVPSLFQACMCVCVCVSVCLPACLIDYLILQVLPDLGFKVVIPNHGIAIFHIILSLTCSFSKICLNEFELTLKHELIRIPLGILFHMEL